VDGFVEEVERAYKSKTNKRPPQNGGFFILENPGLDI
jgi:hypothetical protein